MNSSHDLIFNILVVGNSGVGKTQLILKLGEVFSKEQYLNGSSFTSKTLQINKKRVRLQIQDTGSQRKYQFIKREFYRKASGIIMIYNINDQQSFEDIIQYWIPLIQQYGEKDITKILIGNKAKQLYSQQVSYQAVKQFALSRKINFHLVPTDDCIAINQAVFELATQIMEKVTNQKENQMKKQIKNNQNKKVDLKKSNQCKKCIQFQTQRKLLKQSNKQLQLFLFQKFKDLNNTLKQVKNENTCQKESLQDQINQLKIKLQESDKILIQINKFKELLEKTLFDQNVQIFKMDQQLQECHKIIETYKNDLKKIKYKQEELGQKYKKQRKTTSKMQISQIFENSDDQETMYNDIYTFTQGNQNKVTLKDQRTIIKDPSSYPFNLFGKVVSKVYDRKQKIWKQMFGTGILISTKIVLTSAHNIYFEDSNLVASDIKFYHSLDMKDKAMNPQIGIKVIDFFLNPEYFNKISKKHQKYDMALLELENSRLSQENIRPLKINASFTWENQKFSNIMICGYSGHFQDNPFELFSQTRPAFEKRNEFIYYFHTTYQGTSGAPLLLKHKDNSYSIIGVHKGTQAHKNYGILLSGFRKEQLGWMSELIEKHELEQSTQQVYQQSYNKLFKLNIIYQKLLIQKDSQIMKLKIKA